MAETYTLHVAGLTRELTICKVNDHMDIAAFIMLGDAELTVAAAAELLKKCPDFDILLTAEAKGIPLAHEMSRQSGKPYICARKGVKLYMPDPVVVEDQSITTAGKQKLVIDRKELDSLMYAKAVEYCKGVLEEYNDWRNGNVYGVVCYVIDRSTGRIIKDEEDECWGYLGQSYAEEELDALVLSKALEYGQTIH